MIVGTTRRANEPNYEVPAPYVEAATRVAVRLTQDADEIFSNNGRPVLVQYGR